MTEQALRTYVYIHAIESMKRYEPKENDDFAQVNKNRASANMVRTTLYVIPAFACALRMTHRRQGKRERESS